MKIKSAIKGLAFAVTGLVSAILGIVAYCLDSGSYESSVTYGGDAYTGIQNAAAQTANNLTDLADICKFGFGSILLITGIILIVSAVLNFIPDEKTKGSVMPSYVPQVNYSAQPAPTAAAPATAESSSFSSEAAQTVSAESPAAENPGPGRYCTNCNKNYTDDCDFCPNCGAKLG